MQTFDRSCLILAIWVARCTPSPRLGTLLCGIPPPRKTSLQPFSPCGGPLLQISNLGIYTLMRLSTPVSEQVIFFNITPTSDLPNLGISPQPFTSRASCFQQKWPTPWRHSMKLLSVTWNSAPCSSTLSLTITNTISSPNGNHLCNNKHRHQPLYRTQQI